ncbi:hypothetical protein OKW43_002781 [Paraburkholderia sp. WC7.3g]|uniref:hypothetical protein n=1 Tax=Paraburkholderia sp. WC7.3g TaxID=2991070 RepID=UPI003D224723
MSTKATLSHHVSTAGEPSWHLYEEVFEEGVVYLELRGVNVELSTLEKGGVIVTIRLPTETARQLGLHTQVEAERWTRVSNQDKP